MISNNCYSCMGNTRKELRKTALRVLDVMEWYKQEHQVRTFVVTGTSGLSIAMALKLCSKFKEEDWDLILVRKEAEKAHGSMFELLTQRSVCDTTKTPYVFLDDFIASGDTKGRIRNSVFDKTKGMWSYVGTLSYSMSSGRYVKHVIDGNVFWSYK